MLFAIGETLSLSLALYWLEGEATGTLALWWGGGERGSLAGLAFFVGEGS